MQITPRSAFTSPHTLMVQGCTSDAGKSVMVAGLGRLLHRNGISAAPFKPQNMALNSAVTHDGGEIGRAQAVQALACGIEPHTDMNPVLLKPSSDTSAQVVVHGKVVDAMQAARFHDYKKVAMQAVLSSHRRLRAQYQQIVVEGAGSPAEINLREGDIANMGFAEAVDCPVVLVADIDRGGVFAHLVGTLELLSASEQARVVGFIINRFRGEYGLLASGLDWLESKTRKPVLGVIPYLTDFYLDAEDAIAIGQTLGATQSERLKVVVPVLPRISNHTDFDALRLHPGVDLQFVSAQQACPPADLIILPGSKNVLEDYQTLQRAGWADSLARHLRYGGKVMGICGGFQMLGKTLCDPHAIESAQGRIDGFGLLDMHTQLQPEKQLHLVQAKIIAKGMAAVDIKGYEIHCGISEFDSPPSAFCRLVKEPRDEGVLSENGQLLGTYLHGLFDQAQACDAILRWAGLVDQESQAVNLDEVREQQLNRLADCIEEHCRDDFLPWLMSASHKEGVCA